MLKKLFKDRNQWRKWLEENHDKEKEIWLVFYKVKVNKKSVKYKEAVCEALCFGWIDSTVRRIDDEKHMQRYTPRKAKSNWSALNKSRVKKLIEEGLMMKHGFGTIEIAKQNSSWERLYSIEIKMEVPRELEEAFEKNINAKTIYEKLPASKKKQYLYWIKSAKRDETREKRIKETIKWLIDKEGEGHPQI